MSQLLFVAAIIAVLLLAWELLAASPRRIAALNDKHRSTSRFVGPAQLVLGHRRRDVALAVTDSTLFYGHSAKPMQIDLGSVLAIEYDTVLAGGVDVPVGRVLRLRSDSETIEFVLPRDDVSRWYQMLPPHPEKVSSSEASGSTTASAFLVWHR